MLPRLDALTLRDVLAAVAVRNRDVQAARRALDATRADVDAAAARPNPTVTLGSGFINPQNGLGRAAKPLNARVDQVIERGGKRDLRIGAARAFVAAADADVADVLRQQRLAAAAAYVDLLLAQERVQVSQDNTALFERTLAAAELRFRAGDVAEADVTRLRVDALRAANDAVQAEADRRRAQITLAARIAAENEAPILRAADEWPAPGDATAASIDDVVERRADVQATRARLEAAQQNRELARRQRTRDVSVGAEINRFPNAETNTLGSGTSVGVSVTFPVFAFYDFRGEIARAEAEYAAAGDQLERVRAEARAEYAQARSDLDAAAARLARFDAGLLREAQRSADFAEFAYRNGALGVMDLLDARRVLRATQLDAVAARADFARARAAWEAAIAVNENQPAPPAGAVR